MSNKENDIVKMNHDNDPFEEYRHETDPDKRERSYAWQTNKNKRFNYGKHIKRLSSL